MTGFLPEKGKCKLNYLVCNKRCTHYKGFQTERDIEDGYIICGEKRIKAVGFYQYFENNNRPQ